IPTNSKIRFIDRPRGNCADTCSIRWWRRTWCGYRYTLRVDESPGICELRRLGSRQNRSIGRSLGERGESHTGCTGSVVDRGSEWGDAVGEATNRCRVIRRDHQLLRIRSVVSFKVENMPAACVTGARTGGRHELVRDAIDRPQSIVAIDVAIRRVEEEIAVHDGSS